MLVEEKELIERLVETEQRSKSNTHQIDEMKNTIEKIESKTDDIHRLATSVEVIATKMTVQENKIDAISKEVKDVKKEVTDLKLQPANDYKKLGFEAIKWFMLFGLGYVMNVIIK